MNSNKCKWRIDLLCKHWFTLSVWNFWGRIADVCILRETSLVVVSEEKRLYSQATGFDIY